MVINTNLSALRSARLLSESSEKVARSVSRLSSGSKLTSPEDDAAGLAMSLTLSAEGHRHQAAVTNLENAISFKQTQDGYLHTAQIALDRMSQLAVLALDATKTDSDRANYDAEFQKLAAFLDATFSRRFNDKRLFGGTSVANVSGTASGGSAENSRVIDTGGTSGNIQIDYNFFAAPDRITVYYPPRSVGGTLLHDTGIVSGSAQLNIPFGPGSSTLVEIVVNEGGGVLGTGWNYNATVTANLPDADLTVTTDGQGSLLTLASIESITVSGSVGTTIAAVAALQTVKQAINDLAQKRAQVGANLARLQSHLDELGTLTENLSASTSRIKDVDIAQEIGVLARSAALALSGTAMLVQAKLLPETVLRLLR